MRNEMKPVADFGDIVKVIGYGERVFIVEAYTIEQHHEPVGMSTEIIYDLTCPFSSEYIIGEQEDISVACKEAFAGAYLAEVEPYVAVQPTVNLQVITPADVKKARSHTKQTEIDGLLDELIALQTVIDICGTDEGYAVRFEDVKRKLTEVTA